MVYKKLFLGNLVLCLQKEEKQYSGECTRIRNLLEEKDPKGDLCISSFFTKVRACFNDWTNCDLGKAISDLNEVFDQLLSVPPLYRSGEETEEKGKPEKHGEPPESFFISIPKGTKLYRGRQSEYNLNMMEMFHIPFSQVYKISNQRYSITGQPMLYLCDTISGVVNELGFNRKDADQYEQLYVSQFRIKKPDKSTEEPTARETEESTAGKDKTQLKLFDLRIGKEALWHVKEETEFRALFYKFLLGCVCSFSNIRGRGDAYFIEEYVIPQLVTQHIRRMDPDADGICYRSMTPGKRGREYTNYALYTRQRDRYDAVDSQLRGFFEISMPFSISRIVGWKGINNEDDLVAAMEEQIERANEFDTLEEKVKDNSLYRDLKGELLKDDT